MAALEMVPVIYVDTTQDAFTPSSDLPFSHAVSFIQQNKVILTGGLTLTRNLESYSLTKKL
jgi:hypothetical protein